MNSITGGEQQGYAMESICWICGVRYAITTRASAFQKSICPHCSNVLTRPYDEAWRTLAQHLRQHWKEIVNRGNFDLSKVFAKDITGQALRVHLHFVKLLGCKLRDSNINVDIESFSRALRESTPHADVTISVADSVARSRELISHQSDVSLLRDGIAVWSAVWMHLDYPIGIKVCYIKGGAPVRAPAGFPWHPTRQRRIVKISPYKGDTEPLLARRDLQV